ncbi:cyclic nucleotide-binding [Candidatus Vecturithrix granuli]|uniref:Cyclic nucleotide-binding n=1 Tax=Vecturithrix granuli TaxID=1499967 RepID=A0A081C113_VECG1|nr:cyclic nucleotide-binding [Candidatus Vecturithrix granuli]
MNDIDAEIEKYHTFLASHSEDSAQTVPLRLALGKSYERAGQQEAAIQEFAKVALFYADQGQIMKAMAAAQLIVRIDPEREEVLERLGELYFQRKTISAAQLDEFNESMKHIEALQGEQPEASETELSEEEEDLSEQQPAAEFDVLTALKQLPLFTKLSISELRGIQENSILKHFAPKEAVIQGGNVRRSLFIILQGNVKVMGKDKEQRDIFLATLEAGTSFGEFALFGRVDPNLSVIADQACLVLEIPRDVVLKLAKNRPIVTETLKSLYRRRMLDTALARVPLFSQLAPQDRQKIVKYFKPVKAKQGVKIVREAEPGTSMYFIVSGQVGVYISLIDDEKIETETEPFMLATLTSGDFFGEQALVTDEPHSATVIAETDVIMLRFTKNDLAVAMRKYPWLESSLQIEAFHNQMRTKYTLLKEMLPDAKT